MDNRPQGRQKNVTGSGKSVSRRGSGLGTGPVGSSGGYSGRPGTGSTSSSAGRSSTGTRSSRGSGGLFKLIIILLIVFGGSRFFGLFGGSDGDTTLDTQPAYTQSGLPQVTLPQNPSGGSSGSVNQGFDIGSLFTSGSTSSGWTSGSNADSVDSSVAAGARAKRTQILGGGQDTVTIMVYMCGTDLESKSGMATKDLQEMLDANLSDQVNLIVYTGGCSSWRNNIISSSVNQIYRVADDGLVCLEKNAGSDPMTSPKTLTSFIRYCDKNYPANRNFLILWDHGGGSISGYGYDEKNRNAGSMTLKGLDEALSGAGVAFDVIGFDACLMGSLETGLTMAPYGDYLIASEETEPGLGWYYTDWLTALSRNTSMPTLEVGKKIVDDFVSTCARNCSGQKTTLSVVDLAELETTVPDSFRDFSASTLQILKNDGYKTVSDARSTVREFAVSSKSDQVDLVHLAKKLNTPEGLALADAVLGAVKYNKTSSKMTNAYGLSLYFPYQRVGNVKNAVAAYNAIGLDDAYTDCIRTFASLEAGGQSAAGGNNTPMVSINGQSYSGNAVSGDMLGQLLNSFLGGSGQYGSFFDRSLDPEATARYLDENRVDTDALQWQRSGGTNVLHLDESQWKLIHELELNVFVDDGQGYIDLGLDNTFEFTASGDLIGAYDGTWLAIDGQPVAYYHLDTTMDGDDYTITGRVPVLLNGTRSDLILVFTSDEPYGYIAGARTDYRDGETETVAKAVTELEAGDTIDFLCDYYTYDGVYMDSYYLGDPYVWYGDPQISNVYLSESTVACYRITDLYNNHFWTEIIP